MHKHKRIARAMKNSNASLSLIAKNLVSGKYKDAASISSIIKSVGNAIANSEAAMKILSEPLQKGRSGLASIATKEFDMKVGAVITNSLRASLLLTALKAELKDMQDDEVTDEIKEESFEDSTSGDDVAMDDDENEDTATDDVALDDLATEDDENEDTATEDDVATLDSLVDAAVAKALASVAKEDAGQVAFETAPDMNMAAEDTLVSDFFSATAVDTTSKKTKDTVKKALRQSAKPRLSSSSADLQIFDFSE